VGIEHVDPGQERPSTKLPAVPGHAEGQGEFDLLSLCYLKLTAFPPGKWLGVLESKLVVMTVRINKPVSILEHLSCSFHKIAFVFEFAVEILLSGVLPLDPTCPTPLSQNAAETTNCRVTRTRNIPSSCTSPSTAAE
jgi:hypothetical protein